MFFKNTPMEIEDIFSKTFELLKATFKSSIIVVVAFMLPAAFILAAGFHSLFSNIPLEPENQMDPEQTFAFFSSMGVYFGSLSVYLLLYLAAFIGVTALAAEVMKNDFCTAGDGFRKVFSAAYLKVIVQFILITLAIFGCLAIPVALIIIGGSLQETIMIVAGAIIMIPAVVFVIYIVFGWYFASTHLIVSGDGVIESMSKSSFLVKNYWWRTFGILLLVAIAVDFAISIISTPVFFFMMWDFLSMMFSSAGSFETTPEDIVPIMISLLEKVGYIIAFTSALQLLITPLFLVVMYFDLRIRKNDLDVEKPIEENPFSPGAPSFES